MGCCKRQLIIRFIIQVSKICRHNGLDILKPLPMKSAIIWDLLLPDYTALHAVHLHTHINFGPYIIRCLFSNLAFRKRNSLMSLQTFHVQERFDFSTCAKYYQVDTTKLPAKLCLPCYFTFQSNLSRSQLPRRLSSTASALGQWVECESECPSFIFVMGLSAMQGVFPNV